MMLLKLVDLMIFVMLFSLEALASPAAKPHGETTALERSDVAKRGGPTRWTWYDVQTGNQVYCGGYGSNGDQIVALSGRNMKHDLCGRRIQMQYGGVTKFATIVDMCPECPEWSLDLSQGLFHSFSSLSTGVIYGEWSFV